ncbi:unnamed protein product [Trifolium pratense]|uniref:Uncharacterized protein n=1 Tax=Trifolium pratense TaxID=57577 RepID=A0ACB0LB81_TRIPR|nr:unnamed protein product [Trifolium pratense]
MKLNLLTPSAKSVSSKISVIHSSSAAALEEEPAFFGSNWLIGRNLRKNGDDDDTHDDVVVWFPAMLMKSVMAMNGDGYDDDE